MEKEYGKDKMKKFLKYEMDRYLSGRSSELEGRTALDENRTPTIHSLSKSECGHVLFQRNDWGEKAQSSHEKFG